MARSNKFSTLNLNEIYGNKPAKPAPSSDSAASAPPRPRSSGGMLVLSRPVKKETPQLPLSLKSQTKKDLPEPSKTSQNELTKTIQPIDPIHGSKDSQEQIKHIQIEPTKTINPVNQIQALEDSESQTELIKTIQPFDPIPGSEDSQEEIIQNGNEPTKSIKANNQIQASKVSQEEIPNNQKRSTNQEIPNVEAQKADVSRKNSDGSLLSDGILIPSDSLKSNRNEDLGLTNKNDGEGLNSSRNEDAGLLSDNISLRPQGIFPSSRKAAEVRQPTKDSSVIADINEEKEMPVKEEEVKEHEKLERKAEPFRPPHLRGGLISPPPPPPPPPGKVFRPQQYKEYDIEVIRPSSGGNSHQPGNRDFGSVDSGYGGGRGDSGYGGGRGDSGYGGRGNSGYGGRGDSGYGGGRGDSGYGGGRGNNSGYGNRGRVVRNPGYDNQHPRHDFERYGHRGRFDRIEDHNYRNVQGEEPSRDWYGQEAKHYSGQEAKHYTGQEAKHYTGQEAKHYTGQEAKHYMENNRFGQKGHRFYDRQAHERDNYGGNKHFYRGGHRQHYGGRGDEVGVGVGQEGFQRPRSEGHERSGFRPGHAGHEGESSHRPIGSADSWRGIQKSPSRDQGFLEGNQGFAERNQGFQERNLAQGVEMHGANVRWKKHSSEAYGRFVPEKQFGSSARESKHDDQRTFIPIDRRDITDRYQDQHLYENSYPDRRERRYNDSRHTRNLESGNDSSKTEIGTENSIAEFRRSEPSFRREEYRRYNYDEYNANTSNFTPKKSVHDRYAEPEMKEDRQIYPRRPFVQHSQDSGGYRKDDQFRKSNFPDNRPNLTDRYSSSNIMEGNRHRPHQFDSRQPNNYNDRGSSRPTNVYGSRSSTETWRRELPEHSRQQGGYASGSFAKE